MSSQVFISCGQASDEEKRVAAEVKNFFISKGYRAYVAVHAQTILDVNFGIIEELRNSDYYVFIDFEREPINKPFRKKECRGSLFSHQELALAYSMGFERVIFLKEKNVKLEGMSKYILSNALPFDNKKQVIEKIGKEVSLREWNSKYSRQIIADRVELIGPIDYFDHTTASYGRQSYICHYYVKNHRKDTLAVNVTARLSKIVSSENKIINSSDKTDLKWAGLRYQRNIPPAEPVAFDAFSFNANNPPQVYLHSLLDRIPRLPMITGIGIYKLFYELFSENFPKSEISLELNLTGDIKSTLVHLA